MEVTTKGDRMYTVQITFPGGRTATKGIESEADARAEVNRVRKDMGAFSIEKVELISPEGTLLGLYGN
jgi:hypothetical protein